MESVWVSASGDVYFGHFLRVSWDDGWVYGSFLLIVLLGQRAQRIGQRGGILWKQIVFLSMASSVLFFLITNFGVWVSGTMYPKTIQGFWECYVMGLPFFRNTIVGDLGYNLVFFGSYALTKKWTKEVSLLRF